MGWSTPYARKRRTALAAEIRDGLGLVEFAKVGTFSARDGWTETPTATKHLRPIDTSHHEALIASIRTAQTNEAFKRLPTDAPTGKPEPRRYVGRPSYQRSNRSKKIGALTAAGVPYVVAVNLTAPLPQRKPTSPTAITASAAPARPASSWFRPPSRARVEATLSRLD